MDCLFSGALNQSAFKQSIRLGNLPSVDSITYQGTFNTLKFPLGEKTILPLQIVDYAFSAQNPASLQKQCFVAFFTKAYEDGRPRDLTRTINLGISLDISGSMSGSRLKLAKEAISKLITKLLPSDSFSLTTFNNKANIVIPQTKKQFFSQEQLMNILKGIKAQGGTTLNQGFLQAKNCLLKSQLPGQYRILMVTDVEDSSFADSRSIIQQAEKQGVALTIVGIGAGFRGDICQKMVNIPKFNYLCAVQLADIHKHLVDQFDFTLFPSKHNIKILLQSDDIIVQQVYGGGVQQPKQKIVCQLPTSFPSAMQQKDGEAIYQGSLLLFKLKFLGYGHNIKGMWKVQFTDNKGQYKQINKPFEYQLGDAQQQIRPQLKRAVQSYYFVNNVRDILKSIHDNKVDDANKQHFINRMQKVQLLSQQQSHKQLSQKMIQTIKNVKC